MGWQIGLAVAVTLLVGTNVFWYVAFYELSKRAVRAADKLLTFVHITEALCKVVASQRRLLEVYGGDVINCGNATKLNKIEKLLKS